MGRWAVGPWGSFVRGPWVPKPIPKGTVAGKPFLKTDPEGNHCGNTFFSSKSIENDAQHRDEENAGVIASRSLTRGLFLQKQIFARVDVNK